MKIRSVAFVWICYQTDKPTNK